MSPIGDNNVTVTRQQCHNHESTTATMSPEARNHVTTSSYPKISVSCLTLGEKEFETEATNLREMQ